MLIYIVCFPRWERWIRDLPFLLVFLDHLVIINLKEIEFIDYIFSKDSVHFLAFNYSFFLVLQLTMVT